MKIMIVDDEQHALNNLLQCVKELRPEAEIVSFNRSDMALAYAKENMDIDVAFLDINMPVISGIDLAKEIKKVHYTVNIIFCTAYSEYALAAIRVHASGYVNKPYEKEDIERELDDLLHPVLAPMPKVFIRTFGDFDVFVDGKAITFVRAKCKEMLAYLVSKRGGVANRKELAATLFEDEYSLKTQNYLVHIYSDLVKSLKKVGLDGMLIKGYNQYALDTKQFSCDLLDYEAGKPDAINAYKGEFMAQYEWAEL